MQDKEKPEYAKLLQEAIETDEGAQRICRSLEAAFDACDHADFFCAMAAPSKSALDKALKRLSILMHDAFVSSVHAGDDMSEGRPPVSFVCAAEYFDCLVGGEAACMSGPGLWISSVSASSVQASATLRMEENGRFPIASAAVQIDWEAIAVSPVSQLPSLLCAAAMLLLPMAGAHAGFRVMSKGGNVKPIVRVSSLSAANRHVNSERPFPRIAYVSGDPIQNHPLACLFEHLIFNTRECFDAAIPKGTGTVAFASTENTGRGQTFIRGGTKDPHDIGFFLLSEAAHAAGLYTNEDEGEIEVDPTLLTLDLPGSVHYSQ